MSRVPAAKTSPRRLLFSALVGLLAGVIISLTIFYTSKVNPTRTEVTDDGSLATLAEVITGGVSCSGFMVGPSTVMTAAHCLMDTTNPDDVFVALNPHLARNNPDEPINLCLVDDYRFPSDFKGLSSSQYDYALIHLENCETDHYYLLEEYDSSLTLMSLGYPGDVEPYSLYASTGKESSSLLSSIFRLPPGVVMADIKSVPGNSGGVIVDKSSPSRAVGVTSTTRTDGVSGFVAFNETNLRVLTSWLDQLDPYSLNASNPAS